jgi:hypothetical protein
MSMITFFRPKKITILLCVLGMLTSCSPVQSPTPAVAAASPTAVPPTAIPTQEFTPTPIPDEQPVIQAILTGESIGSIWSTYSTGGSYTLAGSEERLALVGGIPDGNATKVCWVVIQKSGDQWQVTALSDPVGSDWESPYPVQAPIRYWMQPELSDFNHDGIQEFSSVFHQEDQGIWTEKPSFYWWDGRKLNELPVNLLSLEDTSRVPLSETNNQPYRYIYQAKWQWKNNQGDPTDEMVVEEQLHFYPLDAIGSGADTGDMIWEKLQFRIFSFNGFTFSADNQPDSLLSIPNKPVTLAYPWWDEQELAGSIFIDYTQPETPAALFFDPNNEVRVPFSNTNLDTIFSVVSQRLFFADQYITPAGATQLPRPNAVGDIETLPSPDGRLIAWLFIDSQINYEGSGSGSINYNLVLTDIDGQNPHLLWQKTSDFSTLRWFHLVGWRNDGRRVYISESDSNSTAYFKLNPGMIQIDVESGQSSQFGHSGNIFDATMSPDGNLLVEVEVVQENGLPSLNLVIHDLNAKTTSRVAGNAGALLAGNFAFSDDLSWLAWQEWVIPPDGSEQFVVRVYNLKTGEIRNLLMDPLNTNGNTKPNRIAGFLSTNKLVVVGDGGSRDSQVFDLTTQHPPIPLSPFSFAGRN